MYLHDRHARRRSSCPAWTCAATCKVPTKSPIQRATPPRKGVDRLARLRVHNNTRHCQFFAGKKIDLAFFWALFSGFRGTSLDHLDRRRCIQTWHYAWRIQEIGSRGCGDQGWSKFSYQRSPSGVAGCADRDAVLGIPQLPETPLLLCAIRGSDCGSQPK
jgi:hypothetical protein